MKLATLALTCILALSGPFALARGKRHHHSMRHHASRCVGGPNGTAGGPTTVSGTGPSIFREPAGARGLKGPRCAHALQVPSCRQARARDLQLRLRNRPAVRTYQPKE
jgi:hypothetical protein